MLINRERERRELHDLLQTGQPRLALLTGRRRVGKTHLLTHAWGEEPFFLFTGARTTPEINRTQLIVDLSRWIEEPLHPEDYPTWRSVFNLLLDIRSPAPLVIVLDEFQYLADDQKGLQAVASELNAAWERPRPARPLLLVLAGSAVSIMESLATGGGPLYGRFAWQHRLHPFTYWHAAEMAAFPTLTDQALTYGIFGGTPRYLAALNSKESVAENAMRLLLRPTGEVRLLVETALDQEEGLRDISKYKAILRAVASGCTERNTIAQRTGLNNDAGLRTKLEVLIQLGYLETRQNFDARPNEVMRYGMADPAFRFYQRFVEPATSMLARYATSRVWAELVEPYLPVYMGLEFERIVVQAYDRLAESTDLPLVRQWGRWEGQDRTRQSLEIDIVSRLANGHMLTGAIKWNQHPVEPHLYWNHLSMLQRAALSGRKWAHEALSPDSVFLYVAAGGFSQHFIDIANTQSQRVILWSLKNLYQP